MFFSSNLYTNTDLCKLPKGFHKFISRLSERSWLIRTNQQEISRHRIKEIYENCLKKFHKKENRPFE